MIWFDRFDAKAMIAAMPQATLMMGVPTFYTRLLAEPAFTREHGAQHAPVHLGLRAAAGRDARGLLARAPATPFSSATA